MSDAPHADALSSTERREARIRRLRELRLAPEDAARLRAMVLLALLVLLPTAWRSLPIPSVPDARAGHGIRGRRA